jgi:hypothetical protein
MPGCSLTHRHGARTSFMSWTLVVLASSSALVARADDAPDAVDEAPSEAAPPAVEPAPVDLAPLSISPVEPAPVEPAPVEPAPSTPAPSSSASAPEPEPSREEVPSVLVLNLESGNVDAVTVKVLDGMIESAVARKKGLRVVSSGEIARILEAEGEKQALGCVQDSCLSDLAGAMGTRYVFFGHVAPLGDALVMQLRLFDSQGLEMVGRQELTGANPAALGRDIPGAIDALLLPIGEAPTPPAVAITVGNDDEVPIAAWALLGSGGVTLVVAAVLVVASAGVTTLAFLTIRQPSSSSESKEIAASMMTPGIVGVVAGAGLAAVGGALALSTLAMLEE